MHNLIFLPIFLSPQETADAVALSIDTIRRQEMNGEFPRRRKISTGRYAYLYKEVLAWAEQRELA